MWKICGGKLLHFEWIAVHSKTFAVLIPLYCWSTRLWFTGKHSWLSEKPWRYSPADVFLYMVLQIFGRVIWGRLLIIINGYLPTSSPSTLSCIDDKIADLQASVHEKVDGEEEMGKHPLIISDFLLRTCIDLARLVKAGSHYIQYHLNKFNREKNPCPAVTWTQATCNLGICHGSHTQTRIAILKH